MTKTLQAVRGMKDILPGEAALWSSTEQTIRRILAAYSYRELRIPIVENTELFKRSIGEVTDIVEKEMYTFADRNGDSLTLRPEATASVVRACMEHGLLHNQTPRLWTMGPMFRHERPQAGRYRQFHQIDVEAFGMTGPDIDAELILMTARLWQELGLEGVELELNSLGSSAARQAYRQRLVDYFASHQDSLDDDALRRLTSNPLRILDSKNPAMRPVIADAPLLINHLDDDSRRHFDGLQERLSQAGIDYRVNPYVVRGLDYYNRTVFEWVTNRLGAQGTVCGGGRYDGLVDQLGGRSTPGIGFAIGVERLLALLPDREPTDNPDVYVVLMGEQTEQAAMLLAEQLRDALPALGVQLHCGGGSLKSQFKRADRSGARWAVVLGEDELAQDLVGLKQLRDDSQQIQLNRQQLINTLRSQQS